MKFGLCYIPDYHEELSGSWRDWYEGMIAEVKLAERLGFHGAWFAEHRVPGFAFGSPAMFIAACARETSRIRLRCSVSLLPLNNPVRTAEDYAMADVLSHGRLDFGVGRGLYKYDYDIANVPMSESRERFDENLAIIRALWTQDNVTYRGRWTTVEDHTLGPKPYQQPSPPIWVAAVRTEETYAWAGANGFDLLTAPFFFSDYRDQQRLLSVYRENLIAHGHDPARKEVMAVYHLYCGDSEADIAAVADPALRRYQTFTKATDLRRQAYRDPIAYRDWKGFFENRETITLEQMKASRAVIGQPEECLERVAMLSARFGVTYLCFEINFGALPHFKVVESLERFAATAMRHFWVAASSSSARYDSTPAAGHMTAEHVWEAVATDPAGTINLSCQDMSGADLAGFDLRLSSPVRTRQEPTCTMFDKDGQDAVRAPGHDGPVSPNE